MDLGQFASQMLALGIVAYQHDLTVLMAALNLLARGEEATAKRVSEVLGKAGASVNARMARRSLARLRRAVEQHADMLPREVVDSLTWKKGEYHGNVINRGQPNKQEPTSPQEAPEDGTRDTEVTEYVGRQDTSRVRILASCGIATTYDTNNILTFSLQQSLPTKSRLSLYAITELMVQQVLMETGILDPVVMSVRLSSLLESANRCKKVQVADAPCGARARGGSASGAASASPRRTIDPANPVLPPPRPAGDTAAKTPARRQQVRAAVGTLGAFAKRRPSWQHLVADKTGWRTLWWGVGRWLPEGADGEAWARDVDSWWRKQVPEPGWKTWAGILKHHAERRSKLDSGRTTRRPVVSDDPARPESSSWYRMSEEDPGALIRMIEEAEREQSKGGERG